MTRIFWIVAALCALATAPACAQSSPGLSYGQVPTAGQWNAAFASKQDRLTFTPLNQAGGTMGGRLQSAPSTINGSGFAFLPGIAPSSPTNGDVWETSTGVFFRVNGKTLVLPDSSAVAITGGTLDGTTIGGTSPALGAFTTVLGDISGATGTPDPFAAPGTTAYILGRTGGTSPNYWYNPDGVLGDGSAKVVFNDSLSVYGADGWQAQQSTLTPHVTVQTVGRPNGSTAVRMLNGFAASGALAIGTGSKTFTVAAGLNFAVGFPVTAVVSNDLTQSMTGTIASYSGTTLVLNVTATTGSGTYSNWVVGANGATNKGRATLVTNQATPAGSAVLSFADTSSIQVGTNVEFGYDANFASINGIQRGSYIVSKTATTATMNLPVVTPVGGAAGTGVASGQTVAFKNDLGAYLFQDIDARDAAGFRYGTPGARDSYMSFRVNSNIAGIASVLMLGYNQTGGNLTIGRTYAQSFPVNVGLNTVTLKIKGDTGGLNTGTWQVGYNTGLLNNAWAAIGFSLASHGTPTSQNIPTGVWGNSAGPSDPFFATAGSADQTYQLTDVVGAYAEISDVSFTLDKPTPYVAPITSQDYPTPKRTALAFANPAVEWYAFGNGPDQKIAGSNLGTDGALRFYGLNDARTVATQFLRLNRDGSMALPTYAAGRLSVGTGGAIVSKPDGAWTAWTPTISTNSGSITTLGTPTARYQPLTANLTFVEIRVPITTNGTGNGYVAASLPFTISGVMTGDLYGHDDKTGKSLRGTAPVGGSNVLMTFTDTSYPGSDGAVLIARGTVQSGP